MAKSGGSWHAAAITLPANAGTAGQTASAQAVACWAARRCVLVGSYLDNAGTTRGMAAVSS